MLPYAVPAIKSRETAAAADSDKHSGRGSRDQSGGPPGRLLRPVRHPKDPLPHYPHEPSMFGWPPVLMCCF